VRLRSRASGCRKRRKAEPAASPSIAARAEAPWSQLDDRDGQVADGLVSRPAEGVVDDRSRARPLRPARAPRTAAGAPGCYRPTTMSTDNTSRRTPVTRRERDRFSRPFGQVFQAALGRPRLGECAARGPTVAAAVLALGLWAWFAWAAGGTPARRASTSCVLYVDAPTSDDARTARGRALPYPGPGPITAPQPGRRVELAAGRVPRPAALSTTRRKFGGTRGLPPGARRAGVRVRPSRSDRGR